MREFMKKIYDAFPSDELCKKTRSGADQTTPPFQVFFHSWLWKKNVKKQILVKNLKRKFM